MKIRRVIRYEDEIYNAVLRLLPQLDTSVELPSKEYFEEVIDSESIYFFVAENESSEIAGVLTLASYPNITGRKLWIEDVVVDNSFRGQGIGEKLTLAAIGFARTLGSNEVKLTSRPSRIAANQLYLKIGFERYETNLYKYRLT
ncbi:MAG TPA: GNAT family N-acetyltransferase [Bacteroidales bacterium]|nr:GNAT family N-acetyltransferase [Bacteroidales bacterium]